jgi:hypothetical protein
MPLLLNVLRNANGADYRKLRVKAMECAGLIGAVSLVILHCYSGSYRCMQPSPSVETFSVRTLIPSLSFSCEYKVRLHFVIFLI